jgi:hypothetical protein
VPADLITELELDSFRAQHLSPEAILALVTRRVRVLVRLAVGVGKSWAAVGVMLAPETYSRFDLVIYAAPAWTILGEVVTRLSSEGFSLPWKILAGRPRAMCGDLDGEWSELEKRGCTVMAKARLCRWRCPHFAECDWVRQLDRLADARLVLMTEQRLELVREIVPTIAGKVGARRVLVILDEARVLDANFEVLVSWDLIRRFVHTLMRTQCKKPGFEAVATDWCGELHELQKVSEAQLRSMELTLPPTINRFAYQIQGCGWRKHGLDFRYLPYDLLLFATSEKNERWIDDDGIHFIARPYFACHLLLASAHITGAYAGHRLGQGPVASPFEHLRFRHSGTRIINLRDRCGADRHFASNRRRILDTFAVLIMRNVLEGRTTLLVSRKKTKVACAKYLTERLRGWGVSVLILLDDEALPASPTPTIIPLIHYGVLGVNNYTAYQSAYCLNSYYIPSAELNRAVQESEPKHFRVKLDIVTGTDNRRRVELAPGVSDEDRVYLGGLYLRKLEVDPVIQAVGRVRPMTLPREVITFQLDDLEPDLGSIEEVHSLVQLRELLELPTARAIDDAIDGVRASRLMACGKSAEQAASEMGIGRATLFRRLRAVQSLNPHYLVYIMQSETPPGGTQAAGGAS